MSRPLFTIGQVASEVGVNVETIRYYQRLRLVGEPDRLPGKIRQYDESFVLRMRFIKQAKLLGFSLSDIRELLLLDDGNDCAGAQRIAEHKLSDIEIRLVDLKTMKTHLSSLIHKCQSAKGKVRCPLIESLAKPIKK